MKNLANQFKHEYRRLALWSRGDVIIYVKIIKYTFSWMNYIWLVCIDVTFNLYWIYPRCVCILASGVQFCSCWYEGIKTDSVSTNRWKWRAVGNKVVFVIWFHEHNEMVLPDEYHKFCWIKLRCFVWGKHSWWTAWFRRHKICQVYNELCWKNVCCATNWETCVEELGQKDF